MFAYMINYTPEQKEICAFEMQRLFSCPLQDVIFSQNNYDAGRSAYFKAKLEILIQDNNLDLFLEKVQKLSISKFKVNYIKIKNDQLDYNCRMSLISEVAKRIQGIGSLEEDAVMLGLLYFNHVYYLGYVYKDHQSWQHHQNKPQSYSQSLSAREARTLVNIATGGKDVSIVDPCCGVGTVVLEALSLNHRVTGYEIHPGVTWKANRNLEYFGYEKIIKNQDMHTIEVHYDVAILDIPYNLYSHITKEEQFALIHNCQTIADYLVLISYEDLSDMLEDNQFVILDQCYLKKMKMQRYIYYCEVKK